MDVATLIRAMDGADEVSLRDEPEIFADLISPFVPPGFAHVLRDPSRVRRDGEGVAVDLSMTFWPLGTRPTDGTVCSAGRSFNTVEGVAQHLYLTIGDEIQGQGVGRRLVRSSADLYAELGLGAVHLQAVDVGRYVWAMCGFNPDPQTLEEILEDVSDVAAMLGFNIEGLESLEYLWDLYYELEESTSGRELSEVAGIQVPPELADNLDLPIRLGKALLLCCRTDSWLAELSLGDTPGRDQLIDYTSDDGGG